MDEAGWEMLEQSEQERWQMTMEALDAACEGKATLKQMRHLARECGIRDYKPNGDKHAAH